MAMENDADHPASGSVLVWQLALGVGEGAKWGTRTVGNNAGYDTSDFYSLVNSACTQGGVSF